MTTAKSDYLTLRLTRMLLLSLCAFTGFGQRAWGGSPSQNLLIGGAQYSATSQFAYIGAIDPIEGGTLGHGFYISPFLGWSRYTFLHNETITGSQPAASLGIGRAWSTKQLSISLSIAGGYSNTSLSPYAPSGSFQGAKWFAEPEIYAQAALPAGASLVVNAGYLTGLRSYWATTYLMVPVAHNFSLGPEIDMGGGINYRNHAFALRVSHQLTNQLTLAASLGAITNIPGNYHPYLALALSLPF